MIWLVIVAVVFVAGGAWLVARDWRTRGIVVAASVLSIGAYWLVGKPSMPDEPLSGRIEEIEKLDPSKMNGAEMLALAQKRAQEEPNNPGPHLAIGVLMEMSGQPNEALLAYKSALRRDPTQVETIKRLADLRFKMTGQIDETTSALYHEWFRQQPNELRAGYLAGIGDWLEGKKPEAEAIWADVEARTPADDPLRGMYKALRQMYGIDPAPSQEKPPG